MWYLKAQLNRLVYSKPFRKDRYWRSQLHTNHFGKRQDEEFDVHERLRTGDKMFVRSFFWRGRVTRRLMLGSKSLNRRPLCCLADVSAFSGRAVFEGPFRRKRREGGVVAQ